MHSDGTDSNWLRTPLNGLIPYASGGASALGSSAWPFNNGYFKSLTILNELIISGWSAKRLTNKVYGVPPTTNTIIDTMETGEIRSCVFPYPENTITLPSGGTYYVAGQYTVGGTTFGAGMRSANNPTGVFRVFSGGSRIADDVPYGDEIYNAKFIIVRVQ